MMPAWGCTGGSRCSWPATGSIEMRTRNWRGRRPSHRLLLLTAVCLSCLATAASGRPASAPVPVDRFSAPASLATQLRPVQFAPPPPAVSVELRPARLIIPRMGLDATIIPVGADEHGAMIAPRAPSPRDPVWSEVYWWDVGVLPGLAGNAVIAGHVNRPDASPSMFTHLNWLVPGDRIQVVTVGNQTLTFVVTSKEAPLIASRNDAEAALGRIFGPSLTPDLNLITCWGDWTGSDFNRRLVIHATLVGLAPSSSSQGIAVHG